EKLWLPPPCKGSRPGWTGLWATWASGRCPCPWQGGRTHQLRVHCSAVGHPIVGDFTYSHKKDNSPYRMMLHAYYLRIPTGKELIEVCAPDPFVTAMDCNWVPHHVTHRLDETIQELKDQMLQKQEEEESQEAVVGGEGEEALSEAKSPETEEQRARCEQWLAEWALE
uniref:Uncharacterized protein n=1 Tax=Otus sunia TaxID=257818 RepID=A0A8C8BJ66_9STRI